MTSVAVVVQARVGSSRFPSKMLAPLADRPLIDWVLGRVGRSARAGTLVLATTTDPADDALADRAAGTAFAVVRGSADDVLGRYVAALDARPADLVVRVCADNPFVAPEEIDRLVDAFDPARHDYACNHQSRLGSDYADGFGAEILAAGTLRDLAARATAPAHREHVTSYVWDHADRYRIHALPAPAGLAYPGVRLDVDTPGQLASLDAFARRAGIGIATPATEIVAAYLRHAG